MELMKSIFREDASSTPLTILILILSETLTNAFFVVAV